jgi:hypothetical protein
MKFKITEEKGKVILNVKLTQAEIKNKENVAYGWKQAREKLTKAGYNTKKVLEYTTLMNRFAVYEGDFIFSLEENVQIKQKATPKLNNKTTAVDKSKDVSTFEKETKTVNVIRKASRSKK